jgi:hypothetical protein
MLTNVYILDFGDRIKIGITKDIPRRIKQITNHSGQKPLQYFSLEADDKYETLMHDKLQEYRGIGEYFNYPYDKAVELLKKAVSENMLKVINENKYLTNEIINTTKKRGSKQVGFRLQLETIDKLNALVAKEGKTQAKVIDQALTAYASGSLSDKDLLERLDTLAENDAELKKELGQIHDLLYQVLHNQQERPG